MKIYCVDVSKFFGLMVSIFLLHVPVYGAHTSLTLPALYTSKTEKEQWLYVESSLNRYANDEQGIINSTGNILQYTLPIAVPLLVLTTLIFVDSNIVCNFYKLFKTKEHQMPTMMSALKGDDFQADAQAKVSEALIASASTIALSSMLYFFISKVAKTISSGNSRSLLRKIIPAWSKNTHLIPQALHQIIKSLRTNIYSEKMTDKQCDEAVIALREATALAITQIESED